MAYPVSFNMEEFKSLKSFAARVRYASERLPKLGTGSSRVVFQIDEFKVLKLAKNSKGIAQNEAEGASGAGNMVDCVAKVLDMDDDKWLWIEMELAQKINAARFKQLTGLDFKQFVQSLEYEDYRHDPRSFAMRQKPVEPEWQQDLWDNNEFFKDVIDLLINFDLPFGDFLQLKHYGEVNERCVIIDYGYSKEVQKIYYPPGKR